MGFDPITMGALTLGSGAVSAAGAIEQGNAEAASANYNATLAGFNSQQSLRNAALATEQGNAQAAMKGRQTRADFGAEKARAGGAGLDVNTGSPVDVQTSTAELGHLDASTLRSNAAKEAYGFQVQSTNFQNEGELDRFSAKQAKTAGEFKAVSSLVNSGSTAMSQYHQYKMTTGLDAGGSSGDSNFDMSDRP